MPKPQPGGYVWEAQIVKGQNGLEIVRAGMRKLIAVLGDETNGRINRILTDMLLGLTDAQSALIELEHIGNNYKEERRQ